MIHSSPGTCRYSKTQTWNLTWYIYTLEEHWMWNATSWHLWFPSYSIRIWKGSRKWTVQAVEFIIHHEIGLWTHSKGGRLLVCGRWRLFRIAPEPHFPQCDLFSAQGLRNQNLEFSVNLKSAAVCQLTLAVTLTRVLKMFPPRDGSGDTACHPALVRLEISASAALFVCGPIVPNEVLERAMIIHNASLLSPVVERMPSKDKVNSSILLEGKQKQKLLVISTKFSFVSLNEPRWKVSSQKNDGMNPRRERLIWFPKHSRKWHTSQHISTEIHGFFGLVTRDFRRWYHINRKKNCSSFLDGFDTCGKWPCSYWKVSRSIDFNASPSKALCCNENAYPMSDEKSHLWGCSLHGWTLLTTGIEPVTLALLAPRSNQLC